MLITKKWMDRLTSPYRTSGMFRCLAESQSLDSISSKVILLIDETKVTILFLNFFQTKVIDHLTYERAAIEEEQVTLGGGLSVIWRFSTGSKHWRFRIIKKIIPLGDEQREFLMQLE
ncbi:hypothetical protein [Enterococcus mundtii]|uniref:hypothetical protein n=1 Tax=Enterococcus TaxID=1350 RepID=UPI00189A7D22|nr:hypothetical protein [Enterococcus mundtii]MDB7100764.1 hypothetical protein [Enterococcus mundtii]